MLLYYYITLCISRNTHVCKSQMACFDAGDERLPQVHELGQGLPGWTRLVG